MDSPSPALSCSVFEIFSQSSAHLNGNGMCNKGSLFTDLEVGLVELELWLHTMETNLLASAEWPGVAFPSCSLAGPV